MTIPILKQHDILIATIQSALVDNDLYQLKDDLSRRVNKYRSSAVIIDLTELDVMDSFASRILRNIANTLVLCGAKTVIVGLQPDVAFAMVQLGLTLPGIETALDLEAGLSLLG